MKAENVKAVFDIAKENNVDLNVGLFMYRYNEGAGEAKYKGAPEDFDWKSGDTNINTAEWNELMRTAYDELCAARRDGDEATFNKIVNDHNI